MLIYKIVLLYRCKMVVIGMLNENNKSLVVCEHCVCMRVL